MIELTFSGFMSQMIESERMYLSDLERRMEELGIPIAYSTLRSYKTSASIPSFANAKKINQAFGDPLSDEDLLDVLEYSKQTNRKMNEAHGKSFQRGIRIDPRAIGKDQNGDFYTSNTLFLAISRRIDDLAETNEEFQKLYDYKDDMRQRKPTDSHNFNWYFTYLIKKDLNG